MGLEVGEEFMTENNPVTVTFLWMLFWRKIVEKEPELTAKFKSRKMLAVVLRHVMERLYDINCMEEEGVDRGERGEAEKEEEEEEGGEEEDEDDERENIEEEKVDDGEVEWEEEEEEEEEEEINPFFSVICMPCIVNVCPA